ncbi:MAG: T9SS type A sorting domain-containing protein [Bacteroidetes bacterium]|nr:T9SS type A sorting domain-containing protein [Bacteroidota bacterium]
MKKIFLFVVAAAFGFSACVNHKAAENPFEEEHEGFGESEEAKEMAEYEWLLYHDPATGKIPEHMRMRELAFAATLPHASKTGLNKTTAATWQARGPWNVGGRTRAFAIDIANENNLIAGTPSGGMWRSTDGGTSWNITIPATEYQGASCVAQDTRAGHTNTWYFGTGEYYGASASAYGAGYGGNGIYKSTDNGASWSVIPSTSSPLATFTTWSDYIWNIVTDPVNTTNDVVYAAAYGGIYRSTDGGTNWALVLGTTPSVSTVSNFTDVAISATGVVYAALSSNGSNKGLYRSTDGINFTDITPAGFPANYNRIKIGISPADENQVFFLGNTPSSGLQTVDFQGNSDWNSLWKYKYISGNGSGAGGIWDNRSANLPSTGGPFDRYQSQGSYDIVVKVKPNDTNTVFIGGTCLYRSTTGFADATHTTFIGGYLQGATLPVVGIYANHHPDQHELVFLPSDPNKMISSNDGGVFKTNDNTASTVAWTSLNNGYVSTMFYTCAIDHAAADDIVIGGAQDNGSWFTNSSNLTSPWVTPRGGDGSFCAIADNKDAYYFSIQNGKVMRGKLDGSGNVTNFARIDPIGAGGYMFINPFTLDPNNNNIMYLAGGGYLWRNNDLSGIPYASNWDSISTNWTKFTTPTSQITAIAVSKNPANRVYYGTSNKTVFRVDNANVGIPTPKSITSSLFPSGAAVSCVAVDPNNADHVMVAFSNYNVYSLFYSADGGTTWDKIAGNLEDAVDGTGNGPSIRWCSIMPVNGGTVYLLGTTVGLFATTELNSTGTYWTQQASNEIGNSVVDMIDYRTTDGLVVVATHSHGIFSTHITGKNDIVGVKDLVSSGLQFKVFPNPVKEQSTISFNLLKKATVYLYVSDELGRTVQVIANGVLDAGEKKYNLSAINLHSGIYYCILKADGYIESKKIVISK